MEKDIIFFWIPKTGGTSLYSIFEKYNCARLKKPKLYKNFKNKGFATFVHVDVSYLLKKKIIGESYFNNAFNFCFVRNPWDRLVSLYFL